MPLTANDIRGGAKKYASLPSHEKESIDRRFEEITRDVETFQESKDRGLDNDMQALAREVGTHCHRQIVNGGYFQIPQRHGGNVIKEQKMSEEDKALERVVRKIVYDFTIEQAVEFLRGRIDLNKVKGA